MKLWIWLNIGPFILGKINAGEIETWFIYTWLRSPETANLGFTTVATLMLFTVLNGRNALSLKTFECFKIWQ